MIDVATTEQETNALFTFGLHVAFEFPRMLFIRELCDLSLPPDSVRKFCLLFKPNAPEVFDSVRRLLGVLKSVECHDVSEPGHAEQCSWLPPRSALHPDGVVSRGSFFKSPPACCLIKKTASKVAEDQCANSRICAKALDNFTVLK